MVKFLVIRSCSDSMRWYAGHVGYTAPYLGQDSVEYRTRERSGLINFILLEDAEIVEVDCE